MVEIIDGKPYFARMQNSGLSYAIRSPCIPSGAFYDDGIMYVYVARPAKLFALENIFRMQHLEIPSNCCKIVFKTKQCENIDDMLDEAGFANLLGKTW